MKSKKQQITNTKYAFFSKWLEKGEVIHYSEYSNGNADSGEALLATVIIGILLLLIGSNFPIIVIGGIFLLIISVTPLLAKIYYLFYEKGVAITSRKIIILGEKGQPRFIYYNKIFNIKITIYENQGKSTKSLTINQRPHLANQAIEFGASIKPSNIDVEHLGSIIRKVWKKQSPYALFNQKMKQFASKNNLKITPLNFENRNEFKLTNSVITKKNSINNLNFNLSLKNAANFKRLKIEIICNNEEDNFIRLRPEKMKDNVSKLLLNIQDYEINEQWFDDKFLIQSNYEPFITSVLSKELLPIIHNAMIDLKGEIMMGNKADMEKSADFDIHEGQTLDAHLLGEKEIAKQRIKGHSSSLIYTSNDLKYTDDFEKIAEDIIMNIKMLVALAERINLYNEMN